MNLSNFITMSYSSSVELIFSVLVSASAIADLSFFIRPDHILVHSILASNSSTSDSAMLGLTSSTGFSSSSFSSSSFVRVWLS